MYNINYIIIHNNGYRKNSCHRKITYNLEVIDSVIIVSKKYYSLDKIICIM